MSAAAAQQESPTDAGRFLPKDRLQTLLDVLWSQGYRVIGPKISQGAIVYDDVRQVEELPRGWTEEQRGGHYRLQRRDDEALFGFTVGPSSWKQYLFPSQVTVAAAERTAAGWDLRDVPDEAPAFAFLGARACDLAAIGVQDRTFVHDQYTDPVYQARRQRAFIVAVNCTQAASTCFCTSLGTGPRCTAGFDLALTELPEGFTVDVGSDRGRDVLALLPTIATEAAHLSRAETARQQAIDQISKRLDTTDIRDLLLNNLEHPRWNEVAARCLSCTNCTMVCPTCFCSSVHEVSDLDVNHVERVRQWDSCFNFDFSRIQGGTVRNNIRSRYRQWLTHKLASWIDQFDVSGCVGCGRCITWCPVAIDLTEEVAAIRESAS
ncbi:MAG: 4Fe-4S dicluster domain-containing protein [Pirellulales bacterium]